MNKRGIFFTLLAIVIISIFIISFAFISESEDRRAVENRVETLNNFVFAIEEDLPRQLFTSGFRIIFLFEEEIFESGQYISDFDEKVEELFSEGTLDGEFQDLMIGVTFSGIENSFKQKASKINADVSLSNPSFSLSQEDPWNVKVSLTANFIVEDVSGLASWNKTEEFVVYIPVSNFDDPLYIVNTNGMVTHKIVQTPYSSFVSGSDVSNLISHLDGNYYTASTSAPSFLDRLQGLTSGSENGVESLVDLQELSAQGIPAKDKSVVDYIYFSTSNPSACNVLPVGMPSWFKLDSGHLGTYEVSCV